jgi:hypothetical protein
VTPVTVDGPPAVPPAPLPEVCPGLIVWQTPAGREECSCTRAGGHPGDHRDASGYAWNDERWLD